MYIICENKHIKIIKHIIPNSEEKYIIFIISFDFNYKIFVLHFNINNYLDLLYLLR